MKKNKYIIQPNVEDISLIENVQGLDHKGKSIFITIFLWLIFLKV